MAPDSLIDLAFQPAGAVLDDAVLFVLSQQVAAADAALDMIDRANQSRSRRLPTPYSVRRVFLGGDDHHRKVQATGQCAHPPDEVDAVEIGHIVVDQYQVGGVPTKPAQGIVGEEKASTWICWSKVWASSASICRLENWSS